MACVSAMSLWGFSDTQFALGASGAIMGLIGSEAALLMRSWWRYRSPLTAQRLKAIGLIVILQTLFDLSTPQISLIGHVSGLILGLLVSLILPLNSQRTDGFSPSR
jgi:rhomboid protease GluP